MAGQGGGGGHDRADQVRAGVAALAAFEVAIGGAGAAFVGREDVGVHADAHAAACIAPLEARGGEEFVEAFFFGLGFDAARAGNDEGLLDIFGDMFSGDEMGGCAEIVETGIGAGADEDAVHGNVHDGSAGLEAHVFKGAFGGFLIVEVAEIVGIGNAAVDTGDHAGVGAPGNLRGELIGVEFDGGVEFGAVVGLEEFPAIYSGFEFFAARNKGAAFEIGKGRVVGGDHACAGATFDGHVADGHAAVHGESADGFATEFGDLRVAAADAHFSDDGEDDVLRSDAFGTLAVDEDVEGFGFGLHEALRGEDMLDFAGADAECEGAECAVSGGVGIAADDGLAGLGDPEFGADDVDDALMLAVHVEETHAGFATIALEGFELELGVVVEDGEGAIGGGDGMIHNGEGEVGTADLAAFGFEAGEGLGRGAFVDQVAIDVDEGGLAGLFADYVTLPDFFVEGCG